MRLRPVRRAARKVVTAVARRLPPARGRALVVGAQATFTLITGRQTRATRLPAKVKEAARVAERARAAADAKAAAASEAKAQAKAKAAAAGGPEPLTDAQRDEVERTRKAIELGQFADAARRSARLVEELPSNLRLRQLHATALAGAGDSREHALALHRLHLLREDQAVRRNERIAAGHVVVTSVGWLPRLPGGPAPLRPSGDQAVLFLADESLPYRSTPATERLRERLAEARAAGFAPAVVTGLGFPRTAGVEGAPSPEVFGDVPHHRLDIGPLYDLDGPPDRRLRDATWLAAGVADAVRPALLHVIAGEGPDGPLIGAALAEYLDVPRIVEVVADGGAAAGADAERLEAAMTRTLQAADHVVVADAPTRDRLLGRGLDEARLTIVAGDGALAAAYAGVLGSRGAAARGAAARA